MWFRLSRACARHVCARCLWLMCISVCMFSDMNSVSVFLWIVCDLIGLPQFYFLFKQNCFTAEMYTIHECWCLTKCYDYWEIITNIIYYAYVIYMALFTQSIDPIKLPYNCLELKHTLGLICCADNVTHTTVQYSYRVFNSRVYHFYFCCWKTCDGNKQLQICYVVSFIRHLHVIYIFIYLFILNFLDFFSFFI